jgi:AAA domain
VFLAVGLGMALGLAWRCRAWWLGWALLWLVVAPPAPTPLPLLALALIGALAWWPPVRWGYSFLRGGGGMGGAVEKGRNGGSPRGVPPRRGSGRTALVSWGKEPLPRRWLVPRLVPFGPHRKLVPRLHPIFLQLEQLGYVTALVGSGGVGKSYLLLALGLAALLGLSWLGQRVMKVRSVLYVDAELDLDTQKARGYEIARGVGLRRPPGPHRLWHLPWYWIRPWGLHYLQLPAGLVTAEGQEALARAVRRCKAELVLLDSLTIGSGGAALSDPNAWNAILSFLEALGIPVVLIDHTALDGDRPAGSFMKQAKIRSLLLLRLDPKTRTVTTEHAKSNFGPMLGALRYRPVFEHCDPDDPAPGAVRFDVLDEEGQPLPQNLQLSAQTPARRWGKQEQLVLDAYAAHGPAVPMVIAERLRPVLGDRAERVVWAATPKLEKGEAIVAVGKVPPASGKGRPAVRYAAVGHGAPPATTAEIAVAQAEQLLRERTP